MNVRMQAVLPSLAHELRPSALWLLRGLALAGLLVIPPLLVHLRTAGSALTLPGNRTNLFELAGLSAPGGIDSLNLLETAGLVGTDALLCLLVLALFRLRER